MLDKSPLLGPWRGPPSCNNWPSPRTLLCCDWHPDHLGYSGTSLPTDGPDPAATTGTFSSLVSSWHGQLPRVPQLGKEQETLMISPFSLFPLLNPSYPTLFFFFLVPWTKESGQRASSLLGRELKFWFCSSFWQETSVSPPFLPPSPASSPLFFQPGILSSLWSHEMFSFTLLVLGSEVLCLYKRFSETVFLYLREYLMKTAMSIFLF